MRMRVLHDVHGSIFLFGLALISSCGGGAAAPRIGSDGGAGRGTGGTAGHAAGGASNPGGGGGVAGGGTCQAPATDCTTNAQCCSGRCEPVTGMAGVVQ